MSLKDALLKAGLSSSKTENERKGKYKKDRTKTEKHQERRNYCEVCDTTQPDVEKFKHKNPRIDAEWICVNCADKNEIHDKFRLTAQSEFAKSKRYRRFYGPTLGPEVQSDRSQKPRHQGNRKPGQNKRQGQSKYRVDKNGEKNFNC